MTRLLTAYLLYVDAEIPKAPPPGPNGVIHANYNRAVVAVVDGAPSLLIAGYRDRLPIEAP